MDIQMIRRVLIAFLLSFWASTQNTAAQNGDGKLFFKHNPLRPEVFEKIMPGKPLNLSVALAKTRSIEMRIRAFVLIDDRIMDVAMKNPTYNEADELVFSAEVPAPLERLSYQFFAYGNDASKVDFSQKYLLERKCVPIFPGNQTPSASPINPTNKQELGELIAQNADLERELDVLNSSLATLRKIENSVK